MAQSSKSNEAEPNDDSRSRTVSVVVPGASSTQVTGQSTSGQVLGYYVDDKGGVHGFIDDHGTVSRYDHVGATSTKITGVNASGLLFGTYTDDRGQHSFVSSASSRGSSGAVTHSSSYVEALYRALLGRTADAVGLSMWTERLQSGWDDGAIAQIVLSSDEHGALDDARFIQDLYHGFLGRSGSQADIDLWRRAESQIGRAQVVSDIASSAEARQHAASIPNGADSSATGYVTRLYEGLLGRAPDASGLASWTQVINAGVSQATVAQTFLGCGEYKGIDDSRFVTSLYQAALKRTPGTTEAQSWTNLLNQGASRAQVIAGIADSAEAHRSWDAQAAQLSATQPNLELVTAAYETALNRAPDQLSLANWVQQLQSGLTPEAFSRAIVDSAEHQGLHGNQGAAELVASYYQQGLGRAAGQTEINNAAGQLQSGGLDKSGLLLAIARSPEAAAHAFPSGIDY